MSRALLCITVTALLFCLLIANWFGREESTNVPPAIVDELARLRYANSLLQSKVNAYEAKLQVTGTASKSARAAGTAACPPAASCPPPAACPLPAECPPPVACTRRDDTGGAAATDAPPPAPPPAQKSGPRNASASVLLGLHRRWDWKSIVYDMLQPWDRIEKSQLDTAVAACNDNGTMYCQRMQIVDGSLYLTDYRAIFFDRHYAPARIMPILDALSRHKLPNMDIVVSGNDEPRVPSAPGNSWSWARTCKRWPGGGPGGSGGSGKLVPAIFAATTNRAVMDLPWLDFAWFFPKRPHKLRTPPWSKLHPQLVQDGGSVKWEEKIELAMHTGNVGSPYRKALTKVAAKHPDEILVNELFIGGA